MHIREHVELATLVALHGRRLIDAAPSLSESSLDEYWRRSRERLDAWRRHLNAYQARLRLPGEGVSVETLSAWRELRPTLEEILVGEILTRVWTATIHLVDRVRGRKTAQAVAHSVFIGHSEARNQALSIMVFGRGFPLEEAVELNRLRRRCERWTDMLLGYLMDDALPDQLAFEPERVREFSSDVRNELQRPIGELGGSLVLHAARSAFAQHLHVEPPSPDENDGIAAAVLTGFHGDLFDSFGMFPSLWIQRLQRATDDTQGLIEDLLHLSGEIDAGRVPDRNQLPKRRS